MPGRPRSRSPCTPQKRRLPNYKADARGQPRGSKETLERRRYVQDPDASVCRIAHGAYEGRTACYNETSHSARRKTCRLLAPDEEWTNNFPPGLHLWGTGVFVGPAARTLVCTSTDMVMYDTEDIDTALLDDPPRFSLTILGPYPHPVTHKLVVKCLPTGNLDSAVINRHSLAGCFETMERDERGIMVPSLTMMKDFLRTADENGCPYSFTTMRLIVAEMDKEEEDREELAKLCDADAASLTGVRAVLRNYFEAALYFRRWGGPGRPYATNTVFDVVGSRSNPISMKLKDKTLSDGFEADFVDPVEGRLIYMEQDALNKVLKAYDALPQPVQRALQSCMRLGMGYRCIDGSGYWMTVRDVYADGNPRDIKINLFDMCFGTRDNNPRNFVAVVSIQGTQTYCVQVGSLLILRSVLTMLPYVYKSTPNWAKTDGEFDTTHT